MSIVSIGEEGNKEIVFGSGDILISSGWSKNDKAVGVLVLREQEPKPIGTYIEHEPNEEIDYGEAPVRMVFHKIESIDVLIERLEKVKEYMVMNMYNISSIDEIRDL